MTTPHATSSPSVTAILCSLAAGAGEDFLSVLYAIALLHTALSHVFFLHKFSQNLFVVVGMELAVHCGPVKIVDH